MKIEIENFQRIQRAEVEIDGLGVITGPSNRGKSALVRAIGAALFGLPGDGFMRDGEKECRIDVDLGDGKIEWKKIRKGTQVGLEMEVNGEKYTKIGRSQVALTEKLGVFELETRGGNLRPQISHQYDGPFLLSETESIAAEAMKALTRMDEVTRAQELARGKRKKLEKGVEVNNKIVEDIENELEELKGVWELREEVELRKKEMEEMEKEVERRDKYQDYVKRWKELEKEDIEGFIGKRDEVKNKMNAVWVLLLCEAWFKKRGCDVEVLEKTLVKVGEGVREYKEQYERLEGVSSLCEMRKKLLEEEEGIKNELVELRGVEKEVKKKVGKFKVCPLCGKGF